MYYKEVFKALNKARVKYIVVGGTAVVLHGFRRFTDDLDLVVFLDEKNLDKFFKVMIFAGYMPKVPVAKEQFVDKAERKMWEKEKGMVVFSFVEKKPPFKLIDVFIREPIKFDVLYKNRIKVKVDSVSLPVISIEHLIKLKKKAGRDIDLYDIVQLKEILRVQND